LQTFRSVKKATLFVAALDTTHVAAVDVGEERQLFLRDALFEARRADSLPEGDKGAMLAIS